MLKTKIFRQSKTCSTTPTLLTSCSILQQIDTRVRFLKARVLMATMLCCVIQTALKKTLCLTQKSGVKPYHRPMTRGCFQVHGTRFRFGLRHLVTLRLTSNRVQIFTDLLHEMYISVRQCTHSELEDMCQRWLCLSTESCALLSIKMMGHGKHT